MSRALFRLKHRKPSGTDANDACELCGVKDTREHRLLECCELSMVRSDHTSACNVLVHERPEWIYLPIPRQCEHVVLLRAFLKTVKEPEPKLPQGERPFRRFFTDGGTRQPKSPLARIATWSVVEDVSTSDEQQKGVLDFLFVDKPKFPLFQVTDVGIVPGEQTVARAELFAVVIAAEKADRSQPLVPTEFVTDASYVCHIIRLMRLGLVESILHN